MKRFWVLKGLKFIIFATGFILLGGYVIMHLWNWLIPSIFTGGIGFAQAIGILILMRILVGGMGRHRGPHGGCGHGMGTHHNWKERMEQRMANMTPEEKEKFKQQMKTRWGSHCGNWNKMEEKNETL